MQPEDPRQANAHIVIPTRQSLGHADNGQQHAAAIIMQKIDHIYHNDPNTTVEAVQPVQSGPVQYTAHNLQYENQAQENANPYERTHTISKFNNQDTAWQQYHTAWQNYYQQYYERYYQSEIHQTKQKLEEQAAQHQQAADSVHHSHETHAAMPVNDPITEDEAMYDLRSKLRGKIAEKTKKVRKSRHFIPAVAAMTVMTVFMFLQYNRVLFAAIEAYVMPGNSDPSSIVVDPNAVAAVGANPKLIIPKINVDVPIIWTANAADQNSLNSAMNDGVVWFNIAGANAKPGQKGNLVLSGHSSNDWLETGNYKFIFARLEQIKEGDVVYVNYGGTRYTYTITTTKIVKPTDVQSLQIGDDKPYITLVTCTPLGTALNRLLVFGEQVSPNPAAAGTADAKAAPTNDSNQMPSNSPTFLQRIFGGN